MRVTRLVWAALVLTTLARPAAAQQRPLVTEDPEVIGEGRILVEGGLDFLHSQLFPASGLKGNLWRFPTLGISIGIGPIAELQLDGSLHNRLNIGSRDPSPPIPSSVPPTSDSTTDIDDVVIATKIRLVGEAEERPAFALRFATKLPNASNESGLGTDTTDFYLTLLGGKTVQSVRIVGNFGVGILADPTLGHRQNDVMVYGLSFARAITQPTEVVGEINGRASTRTGGGFPGTESAGVMKLGGRYTYGSLRVDAAFSFGLTTVSPSIGFTAGFTYVFTAFTLP